MSSLFGILGIARSGMAAQQLQVEVASHNLANATTEGYSRQRVELSARPPNPTVDGLLGAGVGVLDISRSRDLLLDRQVRSATSDLAGDRMRHSLLSEVEVTFGEPGEFGLGATLGAFHASWADLANDPTGVGTRNVVVQRGLLVAEQLGRVAEGLDAVRARTVQQLETDVARANQLLGEIARLNREIVAAESGGRSAPDLGDARDRALDHLAAIVEIEVHPQPRGDVHVTVAGIGVVGGVTAQSLHLVAGAGGWRVETASGTGLAGAGGTVGAALQVLHDDLPAIRAALDDLARGIAESVNAAHQGGTNPLGGTGVDFFDVSGGLANVTASTLALDPAILADARNIAAGSADGAGAHQPGANDVALAIAGLATAASPGYLDDGTAGEAYRDLVTRVGLAVSGASTDVAAGETLRMAAMQRRESLVGVSTDEELVSVIQFQAAYAASARVVNVVDEMLRTLLDMV